MNCSDIVKILKNEVLPTMGCTEPGSVALAAAYAAKALDCEHPLTRIDVSVNGNVYKNGAAVGIPGTGDTGLYIAAALGAIKKQPENQLSVLTNITREELETAHDMVKKGIVRIEVDESKTRLSVKVRISANHDWAEAIIADAHSNIVSIERNGCCLFSRQQTAVTNDKDYYDSLCSQDVTIRSLIKSVESVPSQDLVFMLEGVDMNVLAAKTGIAKRLGLGIGALYADMLEDGRMANDIANYAKMLTAAAADARMSGESVPVMSSAGSGNHGLTVILPVYAVGVRLGVPTQTIAKAVAISHLITVYIKMYTGKLSALCGCAVAAATGASAAITWLMNGTMQQVEWAMKNVIANLSGMICDGGKVGCALKLSTAASVAVESALLAKNNIVVPETNGIIGETIEQTIKNLGQVSSPGMTLTDKVILDIMLAKQTI